MEIEKGKRYIFKFKVAPRQFGRPDAHGKVVEIFDDSIKVLFENEGGGYGMIQKDEIREAIPNHKGGKSRASRKTRKNRKSRKTRRSTRK